MRKLCTVRTISNIEPIEGKDRIVLAQVDGWQCIVSKEQFKVGDQCMYFEIDSMLPADDPRYKFLVDARRGLRQFEGKEYIRIKTIKMGGQISQGLAMPLSVFPEVQVDDIQEDYTEALNVIKYEVPEFSGESGLRVGRPASTFPICIPKTDEERIQNCFNSMKSNFGQHLFRKSLKLDGSSTTVAVLKGDQRIERIVEDAEYPYNLPDEKQLVLCSRNHTLRCSVDEADRSHFWFALQNMNWIAKLEEAGYPNIALQAELMGPGVQKNREGLQQHELFCFRIFNIETQKFFTDEEFQTFCSTYGIQTVPQYEVLNLEGYESVKDFLADADRPSITHPVAEGIVFKEVNGGAHFKAINNRYLTDCED